MILKKGLVILTDELIDILKEDLSFHKTALKSEAHKYGWLHASVHIWFYTSNNELLLQKRSPNKIAFPNLWDISVAGHIATGESPIDSAIREIKEEIGLVVVSSELTFLGTFKEKVAHRENFTDNELHYIYKCKLEKPLEHLRIQKEELTDLKLIAVKEFLKNLNSKNNKSIVPHLKEYYSFVIEQLFTL